MHSFLFNIIKTFISKNVRQTVFHVIFFSNAHMHHYVLSPMIDLNLFQKFVCINLT